MIVLDTTVLAYATGGPHRFRDPCRAIIAAARDLAATTTVEVIQELVHVRARRLDRTSAAAIGGDYARGLAPLLSSSADDLRRGLDLFARSDRLGAFDSVLAAAAIGAGADALVSADRGFAGVPGLRHVVPDDDGVTALLATG